MSKLPIKQMLADATAAWHVQNGNVDHYYRKDLWGDLACHIQALAAEVEILEAERAVLLDDAMYVFRGRFPDVEPKDIARKFRAHIKARTPKPKPKRGG